MELLSMCIMLFCTDRNRDKYIFEYPQDSFVNVRSIDMETDLFSVYNKKRYRVDAVWETDHWRSLRCFERLHEM